MIRTMLDCVRPCSLDVWRVERCVCVWSSWLSRPTSSSTVVTFSSIRACFALPLSCLWSELPVSRMSFSKVSCPLLLQFLFENSVSILREPYFLNSCHFVFTALCCALNSTLLPVFCHYNKNCYFQ